MRIKSILESLLFVSDKPLEPKEVAEILEISKKDIEEKIEELIQDYKNRDAGICIIKVAGGYKMCAAPSNEEWIRKMYKERNKRKLSTASLETLAIIAYKQPITKPEIEAIRGVDVSGVIKHLLDIGLIKIGGRKDVPGRPFIYITTKKFLEHFGLNSLDELPNLEEFAGFYQDFEAQSTGEEKKDALITETSVGDKNEK